MAKLTRVTGKVFGGSAQAVIGGIGQFGSALAGTPNLTTDVATIQALPAYANGWGRAIISSRNFPPIEEVTGVLKTISYQACYMLQEGIPEYDINTEYSNTTIVKSINNGIVTLYVSLTNNNIGHPLTDGAYWKPYVLDKIHRNIGEIVTSTIPLNDADLHLLDGSLILGNGSYGAFVQYIASLVTDYPDLFVSEADYQASITQYGVCGKFVYDSTNNTVRLPKYNSKIYTGGGTAPVIGNGMTLGLTDGTNLLGLTQQAPGSVARNMSYGGAYGQSVSTTPATTGALSYGNLGVTTDPTKSGIIAQLSDITTALDGYYYIVIATSTKTDIQVDIDQVMTDLAAKADIDLANTVPAQSFINNSVGWGMPDYSAAISIGTSSFPYTAPSNGVCYIGIGSANSSAQVFVNGHRVGSVYTNSGGVTSGRYFFVSKGDVVTTSGSNYYTPEGYFYPLKGVANA